MALVYFGHDKGYLFIHCSKDANYHYKLVFQCPLNSFDMCIYNLAVENHYLFFFISNNSYFRTETRNTFEKHICP